MYYQFVILERNMSGMPKFSDTAPNGPPPFGRLSEQVHRTLLERIIKGVYPASTRLPTEREFAEEFEVSRPVVRSALARLRDAGLVRSVQGSGTVVVGDGVLPMPMAGVTIKELQRCFEFRVLIEGEAAFFAARRSAPSGLELIRQSIETAEVAHKRQDLKLSEFVAFRIYLGRSYGMPTEVDRVHAINDEHTDIFRLIERKQADDARFAMRSHIERARDRFMECVPLGGLE
jgi:GntR family transcriptional regulator, transcriptional repressor for pyruvate dehydrogenase complex